MFQLLQPIERKRKRGVITPPRLLGRIGELFVSAARGALAIPAGLERLILDPLIPGEQELLRDLVEQTEYAQETLRQMFDNDESGVINFVGELAGAFVLPGAQSIKGAKLLVTKYPGLFNGVQAESAALAGVIIGVEGAAFTAGIDPETSGTDITIGAVAGAVLGASTTKILGRIGKKRAEGFEFSPAALAEEVSKLKVTSPIVEDAVGTSDQIVVGIRARLSAGGEGGALGSIRSAKLSAQEIGELAAEFPGYRFEQVGDDVLYGLAPGTRLPKDVRGVDNLRDSSIKVYEQTGFLPKQKLLLDGSQEVTFSNARGNDIWVSASGHKPIKVTADRLSKATGEVIGTVDSPVLVDQFLVFKAQSGILDLKAAANKFMDQIPDLNPALRPQIYETLMEKLAARELRLMPPANRGPIERFRAARMASIARGSIGTSLDERAAAKIHSIVDVGDGRVKTLDMTNGHTELWPDELTARAYIEELEVFMPDLTPSIEGISPKLLEGVTFQGVPMNPAVDAGDQIIRVGLREAMDRGPQALKKFMYQTAGRWFRGMEAQALDVDRVHGTSIFKDHIQPLSLAVTRAMNRANQRGREALKLFKGVTAEEDKLLMGWLESEAKLTFQEANGMSTALIKKANDLRKFYLDVFDEISNLSGTELSVDDFFQNYAPSMRNLVGRESKRNLIAEMERRGQDIPKDLRFWNEMWKSGEMGLERASLAVSTQRYLRAGYRKGFAGNEFRDARAALEGLGNEDAQRTLADYLTGIMGNWDTSRETLRRAVKELYKNMNLKVPDSQIGNIVDDIVGASYSALMGFRVQLAFRNHTQMFNLLAPIVGFGRTASAFAKASRPENHAWALRIGAIRDQIPVTLAEGFKQTGRGKFRTLTRKFERGSLWLYKKADEHNRGVAAIAMRDIMETYIPQLQSGKLNTTQFAKKTGLSFFDDPVKQTFFNVLEGSRLEGTIGQTSAERATNFIAREMSNTTNFLYGAANAPAWVRTAPGKLFGSYSTFSFGYGNYLHTMLRNGTGREKATRLAKHGIVNYSVLLAGSTLGLDLTRWVAGSSINFVSGTGWIGGPHVDLLVNARDAMGGPPWKRDRAMKNLRRSAPTMLIPGAGFLRDQWMAYEYLKDDRDPAAIAARALGFSVRDVEPTEPQGTLRPGGTLQAGGTLGRGTL